MQRALSSLMHRAGKETEIKLAVASAPAMRRRLRALGYQPVFRYEKFRTTYTQQGRRGGEALLDETPIGTYLELEGTQAWIGRVARQFGYAPKNFITKTYGELYLAWCRRRRQPPGNMVFRRRRTSL